MHKRLHIYYAGSVQGVGFRYTAKHIAGSLGLSGWVRNNPDGRVEAVLEGEDSALTAFRAKISERFGGYIHKSDEETGEATGEFENFDIIS
jgi:acylphosphatase